MEEKLYDVRPAKIGRFLQTTLKCGLMHMLTKLKGVKGLVIKVVVFQADVPRLLPSLDGFVFRDP